MRSVVALGCLFLGGIVALASAAPPSAPATPAGDDQPVWTVPPFLVVAEPVELDRVRIRPRDLDGPRAENLGGFLVRIPGFAAVHRSAGMVDPVIRGLGRERVVTRLGPLPLYGACPARMDPPVNYLAGNAVDETLVELGTPSVAAGAGAVGGRIALSADPARADEESSPFAGELGMHFDGARSGGGGEATFTGGGPRHDVRATATVLSLGSYESSRGVVVPANQEEWGVSASLGLDLRERDRLWQSFHFTRETDIEFPSLPMDTRRSAFWAYTVGYRVEEPGALHGLSVEAGLSHVDHFMDNRDKPNRGTLEASTPSDTWVYGASATMVRGDPETRQFTFGLDGSYLDQDALRTRRLTAGDRTYQDRIWPDARQGGVGLFGELTQRLSDHSRLIGGLRGDVVSSDARAADDPSLGGKTVREQYVRFYGEAAADVQATEGIGSANLVLETLFAERTGLRVGVGMTMRAAGPTERHFAFAPAPGGFRVGNPTLTPETKWELVTRFRSANARYRLDASTYVFTVQDYILETGIMSMDVNGDGVVDVVRGFENSTALFAGFELDGAWTPHRAWSVPVTLSYVVGRNTRDDRDLPEIPPLAGTAAVRYDWGEGARWEARLGTRFAARQSRVDPQFPETETPAFALLNAEIGARVDETVRILLGLENLLDQEYFEHLAREAVMPVGGLVAGEKIPGPGRSFYASVAFEF